MVERQITISNPKGLHARPAALVAKALAGFRSTVTLANDGMEIDARDMMGLLTLCAPRGTRLILRAHGEDERDAVEAVEGALSEEFDPSHSI